jgi:hypothetical protein
MATFNDSVRQHHRLAAGQRITGMKHGGYVKAARYADGGFVPDQAAMGKLAQQVNDAGGIAGLRARADANARDAAAMRAEGLDKPGRSRPMGGEEYKHGGKVKSKRGC